MNTNFYSTEIHGERLNDWLNFHFHFSIQKQQFLFLFLRSLKEWKIHFGNTFIPCKMNFIHVVRSKSKLFVFSYAFKSGRFFSFFFYECEKREKKRTTYFPVRTNQNEWLTSIPPMNVFVHRFRFNEKTITYIYKSEPSEWH